MLTTVPQRPFSCYVISILPTLFFISVVHKKLCKKVADDLDSQLTWLCNPEQREKAGLLVQIVQSLHKAQCLGNTGKMLGSSCHKFKRLLFLSIFKGR